MTSRFAGVVAAGALLWASPALALHQSARPPDASPDAGTPGLGDAPRAPGAPGPEAPAPESAPPIDDEVLAQYVEALQNLARLQEVVRQQERQALLEAGLSEEEFVEISMRVMEDPRLQRRLEEHLARRSGPDSSLTARR